MSLKTPIKDYGFVVIQLLLFVAYILPLKLYEIQLPEWLRYSGLFVLSMGVILGIVATLQLNTKLSPFPSPVEDGKLITTGAFRISRHPIYTALLFSGLGYALYNLSLYQMLITGFLLLLFYYKSDYEETLLMRKYPEYNTYKKSTRRFI
ncbi:protein-S-isoprenylcysteine O-methyltransferase Ste14 [Gelidibacter sediminis]|uniref:Protein-S-isoprenylcysteine O-methyltransferase Ste14 n=1 Tax=Gelidibacter sediminis TaxID=1608710 RepID=A0A4R7PZJ0_9FLAO|nr:isoprenylcysteine carboxylmethyltransferase family protein [Gelidibacter sediminis]TDU40464.1 protein-S-isoprenylcysteine O-methyltransferase Ste14 [Gelidibacter sediminis]